MTHTQSRSVDELRRESEITRAELSQTVETLKGRIADTADDIRQKVSPEHIKAEVSSYVTDKSRHWFETLKQQALDNPMQALAIGSAIGVPAFKMIRSVPLPLLIIGAGLALASPKVRNAAMNSAGPKADEAREAISEAAEKARDVLHSTTSEAQARMETARSAVITAAEDSREAASRMAEDVRQRVAGIGESARETMSSAQANLRSTVDTASERTREAIDTARTKVSDTLTNTRTSAENLVRDHAVLVGGLGVAIGALIAASLPSTRLESDTLGPTSDALRNRAADTASEKFDEIKKAATSSASKFAEAGVGSADRATERAAEALKTVADDAVTTAFEPSQTDHR